MKRSALIATIALIVGAILVSRGLYSPLVTLPGISTVRFPEQYLGGPVLAVSIIVLLALGAVCTPFRERVQRFGLLCAGSGIGLAIASLLSIYRGAMDKVQQMNDASGQPSADVAAILAKMQLGTGAWFIGIGLTLMLIGVLHGVWKKSEPFS